jgi:hypothetical protein
VTDEPFDDSITVAAFAELRDGPLALVELAERLRRNGALDDFGDLEIGDLAEQLDQILLHTDDIWMSEDGIVAPTAALLDGVVFSHVVEHSELDSGVLDVTPDLGAIDFDVPDGLELSGGGTVECRFAFQDETDVDDNGSFVGPRGWLSALQHGDVACLRRSGGRISLEIRSEVDRGEAEQRALRAAFEEQHVEGVGVEPVNLVLDALCHDPMLFRSPVAPVGELLDRIGLEQRGAWFGLRGQEWAPPGARFFQREQAKREASWGFEPCCTDAFTIVRDAWGDQIRGRQTTDLRPVARALCHGSVAPAFAEYVLGHDAHGNTMLASFGIGVSRLPGKLAAPGLYLQALDAERDGEVLVAEAALHDAVIADSDFGPALAEFAWYAADRGELSKAVSLLRRAATGEPDPELDYLTSLPSPVAARTGRNDPCPCGSGRKFKSCCSGKTTLPMEVRSGWLYHKLVTHAIRPASRGRIEDLLEITNEHVLPDVTAELLPVLIDIAVLAGGGIEEFIDERGVLLPADELPLVQSWVGLRPKLWEVLGREPGRSVTLRDTRSGGSTSVTERAASRSLREGQYLLALVLEAGCERQFFGAPIDIELRHRQSLIELLDGDPDSRQMALWLGLAFAPPRITNREGEDTVLGRAVLRPGSTAWDQLNASLTTRFGEPDDGVWTETVAIDGDSVVRCFLRRESDRLVVETNSAERLERILAILTGEVAADLEVLGQEHESPTGAPGARVRQPGGALPLGADLPPDVAEAVEVLMREKELRWLDEQIPALGGLTPRQAADDPTRREDLISLLHEFGRHEAGPEGTFGFRVSRLREHLGLSWEG